MCFPFLGIIALVNKEHLNKALRSPPGDDVLRKYSTHGAQNVLHVVYRIRNRHKKASLFQGTLREILRFLSTVSRNTSIGQSVFSS